MAEIEIYLNNQRIDIVPDDSIGLSFQIAKLGELQFIQANASTEIEAPLTKNNIEIFQHAQNVNNQTNIPYRLSGLKVKSDGVWIIQNGSIALNETEGNYKITLYSGNIDLFDLLDDLILSDLDLSSLDETWNRANITASINNSATYNYPLIDYGTIELNTDTIESQYLYPAMYCKYIFEKIITDQGLNVDTSDFDDTIFSQLQYSLGNEDFGYDDENLSDDDLTLTWSSNTTYNTGNNPVSGLTDVGTGRLTYDSINGYIDQVNGFEWIIEVDISYTNTELTSILIEDASANLIGSIPIPAGTSTLTGIIEIPESTILGDGDYTQALREYRIIIGITAGNSLTINSGSTLTAKRTGERIFIAYDSDIIEFTKIQPEISQIDFIKSIAQIFCAVFQYNELTNTVILKQLDSISQNTANAVDWSNKVDFIETPKIEYRIEEYAKRNNFTYTEDVVVENSNSFLSVDDDTLEAERDYINLPFAASRSGTYLTDNTTIAKMVIYTIDNISSPPVINRDVEITTRLFYSVEKTDLSISLTDDSGITASGSYRVGKFIDSAQTTNIGWNSNLLTTYWSTITGILDKTKKVTLYLRLNALDIQNLDFFKPVYLNVIDQVYQIQINGYFYIDKIEEYLPPYSSEVTLVKLGL